MARRSHVLIVEDDELVRGLLSALLEEKGLRVTSTGSGAEMGALLASHTFDIVLLDLSLPDEDGLVLARRLRVHSDIPIIVLTARKERGDRMAALQIGADDYLVKPFDPLDLILRIKNLLARSGSGGSAPAEATSSFGGFTLNLDKRALRREDGTPIPLTPAEYAVLAALTKAPRRVLSRDFLLDALNRGADTPGERVVDVVISRLRKKLGDDPRDPRHIRTVTGFGYLFQPDG